MITTELVAAAESAAYVCIATAEIIESNPDGVTIGDSMRAASLKSAGQRLFRALREAGGGDFYDKVKQAKQGIVCAKK